MNKKTIFRKKAVLSSIFVVAIMCIAATAVPMTNGSKTLDINNNLKLSSFMDDTYEEAFSDLKNKIQNNNYIFSLINLMHNSFKNELFTDLSDFSYEDFMQIYGNLDSPDMTKSDNFKNVVINSLQFIKKLNNLTNYEDLSHESKNYLSIDNLESKSDFDVYWDTYSEAVEHWKRFNSNTFQQWFDSIGSHVTTLGIFAIIFIVLSFILVFVESVIANFVGWAMLSFLLSYTAYFSIYIITGYGKYADLIENQVDIKLHIVENTTDREGIDNLWQSKGIEAVNNNAIKECDGTRGKNVNYFTYYVGPAIGMNEPGWYSLKNRNIAENLKKDEKAPHPPGNWTIKIDGGEKYEDCIVTVDNVPTDGNRIVEVSLNPK